MLCSVQVMLPMSLSTTAIGTLKIKETLVVHYMSVNNGKQVKDNLL